MEEEVLAGRPQTHARLLHAFGAALVAVGAASYRDDGEREGRTGESIFGRDQSFLDSAAAKMTFESSYECRSTEMAARANWKGYLKLSLVSCAVALYPATSSSSRVRFNTLNRATGNRVKQQYVDPETGDTVEPEDRVKGYEVAKNAYVMVEDDELEAIRIESTHTIDIESFVPVEQVDKRYLEAPYYIAPDDKVAQEAFAVIRDAMKAKGKAGVGRVVISRRERMVLLEPLGKGIMATLLRYPYEVRGEESYFEDIPDLKLPEEMLDLAEHIIERKSADFQPTAFEDRYENAVVELLESKESGKPVVTHEAPRPSNVVNLMDALRKSIASETPVASKKAPSKTSADRAPAKASKKARPAARKAG
jgi:DNA end-binding protein Ku